MSRFNTAGNSRYFEEQSSSASYQWHKTEAVLKVTKVFGWSKVTDVQSTENHIINRVNKQQIHKPVILKVCHLCCIKATHQLVPLPTVCQHSGEMRIKNTRTTIASLAPVER